MPTVKTFAALALAAGLAGAVAESAAADAITSPAEKTIGAAHGQMVPSLAVLNSGGATLTGGKLTMTGVAANTIVFADRPVRAAGHTLTSEFIKQWDEGKDSFAKDPPNATISVLASDGQSIEDAVVELKSPKLDGGNLTFDVAGQLPEQGRRPPSFLTGSRPAPFLSAVLHPPPAAATPLPTSTLQQHGLVEVPHVLLVRRRFQAEHRYQLAQMIVMGAHAVFEIGEIEAARRLPTASIRSTRSKAARPRPWCRGRCDRRGSGPRPAPCFRRDSGRWRRAAASREVDSGNS